MKNFKKFLSKTVAPLYFADTYAHRRTQTFKKGLSNEGYAKHTPTPRKPGYRFTWIPHKARCRFSNDGYGAPYPDTPSRCVTRDVIKGRNPL